MQQILYYGFIAATAVPFTASICRLRVGRGKRISWGTILIGTIMAAILGIVWLPIFIAGLRAFTHDFWASFLQEFGFRAKTVNPIWWFLVISGLNMLACILPATGVVVYYQARQKNEKHLV
jgi:lysylphosphatidylglycerol synthetase-like protein (DUF2156 family)